MRSNESEPAFISDEPDDAIHAVLSMVQKSVVEGRHLDNEQLMKIDKEVRFAFSGRVYTRKRTTVQTLEKLVRADLARGLSKKVISQTYGISESTIRRYANG